MNNYQYLFRNVGLLTLSSFATRLLSFFLVPLYTNVLSTAEYGTYDLFQITVGLLIPLLTLNVQEAVLRFAIDERCDRRAVATVGARYLLLSNLLVALFLALNEAFCFIPLVREHAVFFFLTFFSQSLSGIVLAYIRGVDRIRELSVSSVIASAATIGMNAVFLAVFHWGLTGYFLANILGPLLQDLYLILRARVADDVKLSRKYPEEEKAMLRYSRPMIANSVAWWVNSAADRYVVVFFCGLAESGIYSVASKIPTILNAIQTIFNQAWTLSAVKEFDPEDGKGFFSNTYNMYNCLLTLLCSGIIALDKPLARFLYAKDFYAAWRYVPWLTIAIVFGALSGYLGGFFSAVRESKSFARSTAVGAGLNLLLNFLLTPATGALGAAVATAASYFAVWTLRYRSSRKYIKLKLDLRRDLLAYGLLAAQGAVLLLSKDNATLYGIETAAFLAVVALYGRELKKLWRKALETMKEAGARR